LRAAEQVEGGGIVERDFERGDFFAGGLLDEPQRVLDDGEGFEAEEIHLEQAEFAERVHRVLGDDAAVVVEGERHVVGQVVVGDDDAGGMDARPGARRLRG
jgi:hypothetical protein